MHSRKEKHNSDILFTYNRTAGNIFINNIFLYQFQGDEKWLK